MQHIFKQNNKSKLHKKHTRLLAAVVAAVLLCSHFGSLTVYAARTLSEVQQEQQKIKNQQSATQSQLNEAQTALGDLQDEQEATREEIQELTEGLAEIMATIGLLEEDMARTEEEIAVAQADFDAAKEREDNQFLAMKKRIKYLYEKGNSSYVEVLTKTAAWGEMLNQADYIEKLYEYDKIMLARYIALKEEVAARQAELDDVKAELETEMYEMEQEQAALEEMKAELEAVAADYEIQIARVKQEAAAYKAQIKQQNAQINKLKAEEKAIIKAEEERKRREEEEARRKAAAAAAAAQANGGTANSAPAIATPAGGAKTVPPVIGSGTGADIAQYACLFVGNPYVAGGTSLTNGADCSGFTQAVYRQYGYSIPRNSTSQRSCGREVSYADAQPGDIICYAGHVALYIGGGRIVHASTPSGGIKYGVALYRPILSVRRIVG